MRTRSPRNQTAPQEPLLGTVQHALSFRDLFPSLRFTTNVYSSSPQQHTRSEEPSHYQVWHQHRPV